MSASPQHVRIVEVGARDGLQNEKAILPAATKVELIDRLSDTLTQIQRVGSHVVPPAGDKRSLCYCIPCATKLRSALVIGIIVDAWRLWRWKKKAKG